MPLAAYHIYGRFESCLNADSPAIGSVRAVRAVGRSVHAVHAFRDLPVHAVLAVRDRGSDRPARCPCLQPMITCLPGPPALLVSSVN